MSHPIRCDWCKKEVDEDEHRYIMPNWVKYINLWEYDFCSDACLVKYLIKENGWQKKTEVQSMPETGEERMDIWDFDF